MQQHQEERQDMLTEEEWERQLGLNTLTTNQQMNYLQAQLGATAQEAEKQREFTAERQDIAWERQKELSDDAAKSAAKSAWTKLFTSAGLGALTGGIGAATGLLGDANPITGALIGATGGGSNIANIMGQNVGLNNMASWLNKYSGMLNTGTSDQYGPTRELLRNKLRF